MKRYNKQYLLNMYLKKDYISFEYQNKLILDRFAYHKPFAMFGHTFAKFRRTLGWKIEIIFSWFFHLLVWKICEENSELLDSSFFMQVLLFSHVQHVNHSLCILPNRECVC